jgi:hypothetical protein
MADPYWAHPESSELFPEDVLDTERLEVVVLSVDAGSQEAADLLTDPISVLANEVPDIDREWSVSVARVNAERPVGPRIGPRKLVFLLLLDYNRREAAAVAHRIPESGK